MMYKKTLLLASLFIAQPSLAINDIPLESGMDLFDEAERILESRQGASQEPKNWGMREQAKQTFDSIVVPEGQWPLEEMGVPAPGQNSYNMYIMVSSSMPDGLLRSYAFDAMQSGAELVVRGINPDEGLKGATERWAKKAVRSDGASPGVRIDPRPFSAFGIETVPAIVLAKESIDDLCEQTKSEFSVSHETAGSLGTLPFDTCLPAPETSYYRVTGNVSVPWALRRMSQTYDEAELQQTAEAWFSVMPDRYATDPEMFGWAGAMTEEEFTETADDEGMKNWLEQVKDNNPNLEVIKTEMGYGLGSKKDNDN